MTAFDFDYFVIGGGSGGVRSARIAALHGAKVGIAEADRFGGTCVIRGCVPKKLMVYASRFPHGFELAKSYGWQVESPKFDFAQLMKNKDAEIQRLEKIYSDNLVKAGVTLFHEHAAFEDAHTLKLASGKTVRAKHILIATGGQPVRPDFEGNQHALVSNDIFNLKTLPKKLIVVGGGYIAVEFACVFAKLGTEVALLRRSGALLRGFDDELTGELVKSLQHCIRFESGVQITRLQKSENGVSAELTDGTTHDANHVLLATGRRPNLNGLNLERSGVMLDKNSAIAVNAQSQTNVAHIYAVGDVTDRVALTPVAIREGHAVADTLFGNRPWTVNHEDIPSAAFTTPELAQVGLDEMKARTRYKNVKIFRSSFRSLKHVMSDLPTRVHLKLVVDGDTDVVLGAHMLGEEAGEMIQLLAIPIRMKARKQDLDATMAVHPTVAEEWVTLKESA